MNQKPSKPASKPASKEVIPDSVIRSVSSELRQYWQSYSSGGMKAFSYAESIDNVYRKYKITKEEFRSTIDSWISSGKSL